MAKGTNTATDKYGHDKYGHKDKYGHNGRDIYGHRFGKIWPQKGQNGNKGRGQIWPQKGQMWPQRDKYGYRSFREKKNSFQCYKS